MNAVECLDKLIKSYGELINSDINPDIIMNPLDYFDRITESWYTSVDVELQSSPKDFLDNAPLPESIEEIYAIIKNMATNLIVDIPDFLLSYLGKSEYTCLAIKDILSRDVAKTDLNVNLSDDVEILLQATLISSLYKELIPDLLSVYKKSNDANELLLENIADSLYKLNAFTECAEFINSEVITYKHLSLISILGQHPGDNDVVYQCMKNSFKRVNDHTLKMTIAYAIDDYGDSRAVPVLRRYAIQLLKQFNESKDNDIKLDLQVLLSIIHELGGNVEDIQIF